MIDLREELRQRLQAISLEKATLTERIAWLDQLEAQIKGLAEYETVRVQATGRDQALLPFSDEPADGERSVLSAFLRDALGDGQPHSLGDIKRVARDRKIAFGGKNPGRVLHFALLGMAQNGIVQMTEKGVWKLRGTDVSPISYAVKVEQILGGVGQKVNE